MRIALTPLAVAFLLSAVSWQAAAGDAPLEAVAKVVHVQGQVEQRQPDAQAWQILKVSTGLPLRSGVRTGAQSRAALLLKDNTQLRLNQNTQLEIKALGTERSAATELLVNIGRVWTQTVRRHASPLTLKTPTATLGIRGTDWDVEVGPDGKTMLTVFSGNVELSNELGQLQVGRNEAAVVYPGQPPVKLQLSQPRDRVQWVNALVAEPARHTRPDGSAAPNTPFLIEAEQRLGDGEYSQAIDVLERGLRAVPGDADLQAALVRTQVLSDRLDLAEQTMERVLDAAPDNLNLQLSRGLLARRQGDSQTTRQAFGRASQLAPQDDRPWFGLGSAYTELEDTVPARMHLRQALAIAPKGPGYQGELGTLETFSNRFGPAREAFDEALKQNPADYVALTGQGLMYLKQGQPQAALDVLLQAELMEPRYARSKTYKGVAYWNIGEHTQALSTLQAATELDDKDPLPHMLLTQAYTDLFRAEEAVVESRKALARMPYLKSLNQLANDQQGRANLGSSLAFFGMEDWALEMAQQSYSPYWGGSHLFLADRYAGEFNKNSQLFRGFLTDPLAFGAGNRYTSLVQTAGHHGALDAQFDHNQYRMFAPGVTLNGLHQGGFPVAYFFKAQRASASGQPIRAGASLDAGVPATREQLTRDFFGADGEGDLGATLGTVALGARPTERLGLFTYWNRLNVTMDGRNSVNPYSLFSERPLGGTTVDFRNHQSLAGASYRWGPQSQTWLLAGRRQLRQGYTDSPSLWLRDRAFATLTNDLDLDNRIDELQLRHTWDLSPATQISVGFELTRETQSSSGVAVGQHVALNAEGNTEVNILGRQLVNDFDRRFTAVRMGVTHQPDPVWTLQGHVVANKLRLDATRNSYFGEVLVDERGIQEDTPISYENLGGVTTQRPVTGQMGLVFQPNSRLTVRAAYQDWLRPLSVGTLDSVETVGIPVEDQLVKAGGRYKRSVVQAGWVLGENSFVTARLSQARIDNPAVRGLSLQTPAEYFLAELRNAQLANLSSIGLMEDTPDFTSAKVSSALLAWNGMMTKTVSAYAKYQHQTSRLETGGLVPYLPRHTVALGGTWVSPQRLYVNARAVYRSRRFADDTNLYELSPGWRLDLVAFVESANKRWVVGAGALNLGGKETPYSARRYIVNVRYRF